MKRWEGSKDGFGGRIENGEDDEEEAPKKKKRKKREKE
jgi:hypothetical protein